MEGGQTAPRLNCLIQAQPHFLLIRSHKDHLLVLAAVQTGALAEMTESARKESRFILQPLKIHILIFLMYGDTSEGDKSYLEGSKSHSALLS